MTDLSRIPPPPPGFVLDEQQPAAAAPSSPGNVPPPPPGFELTKQPNQSFGTLLGTTPSTLERVGNAMYDAGKALGLPVDQMRRDNASVDAGMRGAADMLSFGTADELAAGASSLTGVGGQPGNFTGNLKLQRAIDSADEQMHPGARLAGQVGGGVLGATAMARNGLSFAANAAQAGRGWMARILGGAADGGLSAGAYGAGSGEGARDRVWNAARNAPLGIALGAGGEAVATGLGALGRRVFQGASDVAPGVNAARNVSEAAQFGIPLSRAQATRSIPQTSIENQLRSQGTMSGFDQAQRDALGQSVGDVQSRIAGAQPVIPGQAAAYETVPYALRGVRDDLKAASQDAYEASVNNPNVLVSGQAVADIPKFIRGKLDADQILIDPMYHQGASRAMSFIDDYIGRMPKPGGDVQSVQAQLRWVENLRAGLRKNFPPIGQDAPALKAISSAIDDWTDNVFDRGLVNASDDVLQELKTARSKWSEYKGMTDPRSKIGGRLNPQYEAQARVRTIMDKDYSSEEVGQYLWGTSVASPKNASFMTAQELRRHLGADSPQWSGVRQSFWLRATRAGDDTLQPHQIAKNLDGLLEGNGKGVANVLYSPEEREMMQKFAGVMRNLSLVRDGINGSNTANRMMPTLGKYATGILSALAGGGGFIGGLGPMESMGLSAATGMASRGLGAASRMSRVRAATSVPVPINPIGMGGATLRGAGMVALPDQSPGNMLTVRQP